MRIMKKISGLSNRIPPRRFAAIAGFCALVLFVAVVLFSDWAFYRAAFDLSSDRRHSLSDGSKNMLRQLEENIDVYFYYSKKLDIEVPDYAIYARQIESTLRQYQRLSNGRLKLHFIDPEPFSEDEEKAIADGMQPIPLYGGTQQAWFGLFVKSGLGNKAVIPIFDPARENLLEYDLTRLIYVMLHPKKPKIGVFGALPADSDIFSPLMQGDGAPAPWILWTYLSQQFQLQRLPGTATAIPDDVDALLIMLPMNLSDSALYAIDQHILRHGKAVILLDPLSEAAIARTAANPDAAPISSNFKKMLDHWGVQFDTGKVVGDRALAQRVVIDYGAPGQSRPSGQDYIPWLKLDDENINKNDLLTAHLHKIHLASSGYFTLRDGAAKTLTPLLQSSSHTMLIDTNKIKFMPDPRALLAEFQDSGQVYTLAARLSGNLTSAFDKAPDVPGSNVKLPDHVTQSAQSAQIILVGDADMAEDRFWVRVPETVRSGFAVPLADNADFIINALENILGGEALSGIRTRQQAARPLTAMHRLRQNAEDQFLRQEKELKQKLESAETRLRELLSANKDQQQKDVQDTVAAARRDIAENRANLRAVQLELNRDIEGLQNKIRFALIIAWPAAVAAIVWIALSIRRRKYRA